jgi:hypothetical protein
MNSLYVWINARINARINAQVPHEEAVLKLDAQEAVAEARSAQIALEKRSRQIAAEEAVYARVSFAAAAELALQAISPRIATIKSAATVNRLATGKRRAVVKRRPATVKGPAAVKRPIRFPWVGCDERVSRVALLIATVVFSAVLYIALCSQSIPTVTVGVTGVLSAARSPTGDAFVLTQWEDGMIERDISLSVIYHFTGVYTLSTSCFSCSSSCFFCTLFRSLPCPGPAPPTSCYFLHAFQLLLLLLLLLRLLSFGCCVLMISSAPGRVTLVVLASTVEWLSDRYPVPAADASADSSDTTSVFTIEMASSRTGSPSQIHLLYRDHVPPTGK